MAAASTDKLRKSYSFLQKSLSGSLSAGATTLTLNNATNLPTDTAVDVIIDRIDSNGNRTTGNVKELVKGVVSGSQITNLTRGLHGTTDQSHSSGAVVELVASGAAWNDLIDHLLTEHNQDGTHGAITSTNATLTTPKVVTSINDANGNEVIKTPATSSAVNEVTVTNAATGSDPVMSATGGDTNIALSLKGKGTGGVKVELRTQTDISNSIANAATSGLRVMTGWGQLAGSGTSTITESVTFPTAFSTAVYAIIVTHIGRTASSTPAAALSDFTNVTGMACSASAVSTTGFTFTGEQVAAANLSASNYWGYSWIAIGV